MHANFLLKLFKEALFSTASVFQCRQQMNGKWFDSYKMLYTNATSGIVMVDSAVSIHIRQLFDSLVDLCIFCISKYQDF